MNGNSGSAAVATNEEQKETSENATHKVRQHQAPQKLDDRAQLDTEETVQALLQDGPIEHQFIGQIDSRMSVGEMGISFDR